MSKVRSSIYLLLWIALLILITSDLKADTLFLANNKKISGKLTFIGDDFIEFRTEKVLCQYVWIRILKRDLLAVLSDKGKILYPRDKYDENALNIGKVQCKTVKEIERLKNRKKLNEQAQFEYERREKNKLKVAIIVGSIGSLMLWTFLDYIK